MLKLRGRSPGELVLAGEAFFLLSCFRAALRLISVRRIIRFVTRGSASGDTSLSSEPDDRSIAEALRVRWAILAVTRHSPAKFVCFPQSLAAYLMLRRRGIRSTVVYGVARSPEGELIAHTWVTVGDRTVVGGEGADFFSPLERWT